jgi:hypothetical protein
MGRTTILKTMVARFKGFGLDWVASRRNGIQCHGGHAYCEDN